MFPFLPVSTAHVSVGLSNTPWSVDTNVDLPFHLLKDLLVASKLQQLLNQWLSMAVPRVFGGHTSLTPQRNKYQGAQRLDCVGRLFTFVRNTRLSFKVAAPACTPAAKWPLEQWCLLVVSFAFPPGHGVQSVFSYAYSPSVPLPWLGLCKGVGPFF